MSVEGPDLPADGERVTASFRLREDDPPLILRGGKVNPEAVRLAYERAAEEGRSDDDPLWRVDFVLARDLQTRLDKYLTSRIAFMSRSQLQRLIESGGVEVNAGPTRSATKLRKGDRVSVTVPPPPSDDILPQHIPLHVLHEDDHLVVLNKQPGVIVHPARTEKSGTLINALTWHFMHVSPVGGELSPLGADKARPGVVHRLDRDTTGCIVFAKTEEAHWKLGRQFELRTVDKRYLAIVHGRVSENAFAIDLPIGPHPSKERGFREKQIIRHDEMGKPSLTLVHVRERYRLHAPIALGDAQGEQDFTLLELELKTGRTHQIRVHLSHDGWPIVGDDMYDGRALTFGEPGASPSAAQSPSETPSSGAQPSPHSLHIGRQMLHAALLAFDHPVSGERLTFTAPLPDDMRALAAKLRTGSVQRLPEAGLVAGAGAGASAGAGSARVDLSLVGLGPIGD